MSLYAIKDEDGALRDAAGASPDETDGLLIWTKRSNADTLRQVDYPDGHVVELVEKAEPVEVSHDVGRELKHLRLELARGCTESGTGYYVDRLNRVYGLDIADIFRALDVGLAASSTNHKCDRYFTEQDDALSQDWATIKGPLFLNPPYGRNLRQWIEKAYKAASATNLTIILLIPARTDTSYWHDFIFGKANINFIRGRLKFEVNGIPGNSAPFPSAIVIYNKPVEVTEHD